MRDSVLRVFMTVEARTSRTNICSTCPVGSTAGIPEYICVDCFSRRMSCAACCVRNHAERPLDAIKVCYLLGFIQSNLLIATCFRNGMASFLKMRVFKSSGYVYSLVTPMVLLVLDLNPASPISLSYTTTSYTASTSTSVTVERV